MSNAMPFVEIVACLALIGEIPGIERHLWILDVLRCQDDFVVNDITGLQVTRLAQPTIQQPTLGDIRPTALLPLL